MAFSCIFHVFHHPLLWGFFVEIPIDFQWFMVSSASIFGIPTLVEKASHLASHRERCTASAADGGWFFSLDKGDFLLKMTWKIIRYGGFLKWAYPQEDGLYSKIPSKWMMTGGIPILGNLHMGNHRGYTLCCFVQKLWKIIISRGKSTSIN